jgi:hypothetical protein
LDAERTESAPPSWPLDRGASDPRVLPWGKGMANAGERRDRDVAQAPSALRPPTRRNHRQLVDQLPTGELHHVNRRLCHELRTDGAPACLNVLDHRSRGRQ